MTNLPTLSEVAADPGVIASLPLEVLDAISAQAEEAKKIADAARKAVIGVIESRLAPQITAAFLAKQADTGTVHVAAEGYEVEINRPKRVEWDQSGLQSVWDKIRAAGDDPGEYIKVSMTVDERAYTGWPTFLRSQFAEARTVKTGAVSIKLTPAKSEAA